MNQSQFSALLEAASSLKMKGIAYIKHSTKRAMLLNNLFMNAGMLINAQDYEKNKLPSSSHPKNLSSNEILPQPVIENNSSVTEGSRARIAIRSFAAWPHCIKSKIHLY